MSGSSPGMKRAGLRTSQNWKLSQCSIIRVVSKGTGQFFPELTFSLVFRQPGRPSPARPGPSLIHQAESEALGATISSFPEPAPPPHARTHAHSPNGMPSETGARPPDAGVRQQGQNPDSAQSESASVNSVLNGTSIPENEFRSATCHFARRS